MPKRELLHPTMGSGPGFSRAIEVSGGRTIYFAGQAPNAPGVTTVGVGDVVAQAEACFGKLKALVESAGGTMNDFVMLNMYVTDMKSIDTIRGVLATHFTEAPFPCMSGYQVVALGNPDWEIEIDGVAFLDGAA
jgi:enamine deaminase RidA (YjgF/YER057c/UK114 family)